MLTSAVAYIDTSDPGNPGWAYRLRYDGGTGTEESGELAADSTASARRELRDLVASILGDSDADYATAEDGITIADDSESIRWVRPC